MNEYAPTVAVLLDVDGTLLDSNDAHARSWVEALRRQGQAIAYERVRALIGKGSDKLLAELLGLAEEDPLAKRLAADCKQIFLEQHLPSLQPTPGARPLLERMKSEGLMLVVATSANGAELQALLKQAGIEDLIEGATTANDAEHSKPDPDIIKVALRQCGVEAVEAMMLGDTPYDIEAAAAAGVDTIALRCGGWWDDAALAKAVALYDSPAALLEQWKTSPIYRRRIPAG